MATTNSPTTYNQQFEAIALRFPERVVFRLKTPEGYREVSYRELHQQARGVALALAAEGLPPGARIAILAENRPEWVVAYLGIFLAGMTVVPLDVQISPPEWRLLLDDSAARLVFVSRPLLARLETALADSLLASRIVCLDPVRDGRDARGELPGMVAWAHALSPAPALPECRAEDLAVLIYTSGTTGRPKGVMLTHGNIVSELLAIFDAVEVSERDSLLCLLPLHHVFASIINVLTPMFLGAQVTFVDTVKRSEILDALARGGVTILATVPQFFYLFYGQIQDELAKRPLFMRRIFAALLALNGAARRLLKLNLGKLLFGAIHRRFGSRLRMFVSGASPFDPKVARTFFNLGFTILQGYGLTETTGGCSITRIENNVLGSVGHPLLGIDIRISEPDEAGVGEILIRGPIVMKGYYNAPEADAEVLRDGWFHSGDLGRIDARGNLYVTGRKKEVIVLANGKNIYPDELEAHYRQCPYIEEIAVLGISTPGSYESSERLHAVVVPDFEYLKSKKIANAREIVREEIGHWSNQLPKYKRLMSYQIQKEPLPRTTTRKIKRLELKRLIESGELRETEPAQASAPATAEDLALLETAPGQEVLRCLKEDYKRPRVGLEMNLELDLGFDSMERVELLTSLEQSLNVELPQDAGLEIFSVRDLISTLDLQTHAGTGAAAGARQSWSSILSQQALEREGEWQVRFSGPLVTLIKYLGLRLVYIISRIFLRLECQGLENLPKDGPYLICPNHLSYIDPFVVLCVVPYRIFRQVFFVGASEYFTTWFMKLLARLGNIVPVDPDAHLLQAMKVGASGLRRSRILCIFPEGARSFEGDLKEFKNGAAILAREVGVPIVPVAIHGAYEVWRRGSMRIRPHKVKLLFGPPIRAGAQIETAPYRADTENLRNTVAGLLGRLSAGGAG